MHGRNETSPSGVLNGKNVFIYSDTTATNAAGGMVNFNSNSYAFMPNSKHPLTLQDFGTAEKPKVPVEIMPWHGTETCWNNFIWPNSKRADISSIQERCLNPGIRKTPRGSCTTASSTVPATSSSALEVISLYYLPRGPGKNPDIQHYAESVSYAVPSM